MDFHVDEFTMPIRKHFGTDVAGAILDFAHALLHVVAQQVQHGERLFAVGAGKLALLVGALVRP